MKPAQYDFFDLKGGCRIARERLCICPASSFATAKPVPWLHPGAAAELRDHGKSVGAFGELHPKVAANFGLGGPAVQVAELDLEAILAAVPERYALQAVLDVPAREARHRRDRPADTPAETVLAEIRAAGGDLLTDASCSMSTPARASRPARRASPSR